MAHYRHGSPLEKLNSERFVFYLLALLLYLDIALALTGGSSLVSPDSATQMESLIPHASTIILSYVFLAGFILPMLHSLLVDIAVPRAKGGPVGELFPEGSIDQRDLVRFAVMHNNLAAYELAERCAQDTEIKKSTHFAAFSVLCYGVIEAVLAIMGYAPLLRDAVTRASAISRPLGVVILVGEIIFFLYVCAEVFSIEDWTTNRRRLGEALEAHLEAELNGRADKT